jgi:hypothetical protein
MSPPAVAISSTWITGRNSGGWCSACPDASRAKWLKAHGQDVHRIAAR